jgi:hypothetical protein
LFYFLLFNKKDKIKNLNVVNDYEISSDSIYDGSRDTSENLTGHRGGTDVEIESGIELTVMTSKHENENHFISKEHVGDDRSTYDKNRTVDNTATATTGFTTQTTDDYSLKALEFLYESYDNKYWYWEIIETYRRIFMTAVLSIISPGTPTQNVLAIMIAWIYLCIYGRYRPYRQDEDNIIGSLGLNQVFFTFFAALICENNLIRSELIIFLGIILILVNCSVLVLSCYYSYLSFKEMSQIQAESDQILIDQGHDNMLHKLMADFDELRDTFIDTNLSDGTRSSHTQFTHTILERTKKMQVKLLEMIKSDETNNTELKDINRILESIITEQQERAHM